MKRCVVQFRDGTYANLRADTMYDENGLIYVREDGALVGVFDLSCVMSIHLSEMKPAQELKK